MNKNQKSYFLTIIMLSVWLLLTSIPYYALSTYDWAIALGLISDRARIKDMSVQRISSAFFNSNHCINILIYIFFHRSFRAKLLEFAAACFNLNPIIKMNPYYFAYADDKFRLAKSNSFRRSLKRCSSEEMDSFNESVIKRNRPTVRGKVNDRKMRKENSIEESVRLQATSPNDEANVQEETSLTAPRRKTQLMRQDSMFVEDSQAQSQANNKLFLLNEKSFIFKYYKRVKNEALSQKEHYNNSNNNETTF